MGSVPELSCSVNLYGAQTGDTKEFEQTADDFVQHACSALGRRHPSRLAETTTHARRERAYSHRAPDLLAWSTTVVRFLSRTAA